VRQTTIRADGEPIRFHREPDGSITLSTTIRPQSQDFGVWNALEKRARRFADQSGE
jgi:hypothetical protein